MVKVSVVIPVYNVENYIRDCLDSIVNQTLTDIEIICINDGSPDNSLSILYEYSEKDSRITVIDQENGGHAVATNRGIDLATGETLFLMDSDDVLELNALELSYNRLKEKDVDFVMFKAINYNDPQDRYYETEVYSMGKIYSKVGDEVFNYNDIGSLMFEASVTPWSKLYRRDFILNNNIRFPEGLIFEDNVFFYDALLSAEKVCFLNEFLFIRRWYKTSSTTNGDLRFLDSISVANLIIDVFKKHDEYQTYKNILFNRKISLNLMRYNKIKPEFKEIYFQAFKRDLTNILTDTQMYEDFIDSAQYTYKKIFEQIIISENSYEFDQLRKIYSKQMQSYKLFNQHQLLNNFIKAHIDYYNNADIAIKDEIFQFIKSNFLKVISRKQLYNELMKKSSYFYKKNFEHILISENPLIYEQLRDVYAKQMQNNTYINKTTFNDIIENVDTKIRSNNYPNKEKLLNDTQKFLIEIFNDDVLYENFFNQLTNENKRNFDQLIISESSSEYIMLKNIINARNRLPNYQNNYNKINEEYSKVKKFNSELNNSNSMKLTKVFRSN